MVFTLRFTGTLNKFDGTIEPHCWQSKGFATAADASGAWPAIQSAMAIDGPKYQGGTAVIGNPPVVNVRPMPVCQFQIPSSSKRHPSAATKRSFRCQPEFLRLLNSNKLMNQNIRMNTVESD